MKLPGCAWCPHQGQAGCNLIRNWNMDKETNCSAKLYKNQTTCDCEDKCSLSFEREHPACYGGNMVCGKCQDCPKDASGKFCTCGKDGREQMQINNQLKELPYVTLGKRDILLANEEKSSSTDIKFHHRLAPIGASTYTLLCNATYCKNSYYRDPDCSTFPYTGEDPQNDFARAANLFGIYADHRLLPGSELTFKVTYCPLGQFPNDKNHETWFGFGTPKSKDQEYKLPMDHILNSGMEYYTDDALMWEDSHRVFGADNKRNFALRHFQSRSNSFGPTVFSPDLGFVEMNIDSDIKLVVTDTEVIWSWKGFRSEKNPGMKESRHAFNITEKEYYPLFILPGCENEGQFSAIKILGSTFRS